MIAGELPLHEELLLFGLHETKGTVACPDVEVAMAGASSSGRARASCPR